MLVLATCAVASDIDPVTAPGRVDRFLEAGVANGFSGAVLIAKDGEIILNRGYGLADKATNTPNTPDTVFDIGSVTKQFTAAAILLLSAEDKLSVDDPLSRFFPSLPKDKQDITLHQLLTHTAGFPASIGRDFDHTPREQFFNTLFEAQLQFEPGDRYQYSNTGYSILGRIIEIASCQGYETFLSERLFRPAGMNRTGYLLPAWDDVTMAQGYMRNVVPRGSMVDRYIEDGRVSWHLKGNGGINATHNDMFRWYLALRSHRVLSSDLTTKLTTPYVAEQPGGSSHYAYGWAIYTSDRSTPVVSHNGGNGVFFHEFLWLPEDDVAIIFSTNAASRQVEVAWTVERMLFDTDFEPGPIVKNVYQYVFDFMAEHPPKAASQLEASLRSQYATEMTSPDTLNRIGYMTLRSGQSPEWTVAIFELNTRLFERNANVWDSLGDGYRASGDKARAIRAYGTAERLGGPESARKIDELRQREAANR
ncbi:MAG: serine hydrolase domain-containing protein [Pseudomonadota bacterium]